MFRHKRRKGLGAESGGRGARSRMPSRAAWLVLIVLATLGPIPEPARGDADRPARPARQPNLIVILADDLGWNDVGYHGSEIRTPHIDSLAENGVRLDQFYVWPTCSPTRVAVLTGRNPAHWRVYGPLGARTEVQPVDMRLTFALKELGYTTHISGKWHIGETPEHRPLRYGFDSSYGYLRGQIDPYTHRYKFGDHVTWHRNDEFVDERGHVTDLITEDVVRVIENAGEQPFFLYVNHHSPHFPLNEPPSWIEPYEDVFEDHWRQHFAGAVTHLDDGVGQIIAALERTGQREHTLVVFLSDNGGQESWSAPVREYNGRYAPHTTLGDNRPLRGWKGQLYEGGIRVPALVNWPGMLEAGGVLRVPTGALDLAPTLIRLAGGDVDSQWNLEGEDLWPVLTDQATDLGTRQFYWNHGNRLWAVRDGDWKLILHRDGRTELFHLAEDPYEQEDVADQHPERVERLREEIARLQEEIG